MSFWPTLIGMRFLGSLHYVVRTILCGAHYTLLWSVSGTMLSIVGVSFAQGGTPVADAASSLGRPLTAAFENVPAAHSCERRFSFQAAFSEDIATSYKTLRDESFTVTGGEVMAARRVDGRDDLWEIQVEPDLHKAMTITLRGGRACGASGAVCTGGNDPAPLSNSPSATVQYVPALCTLFYALGVETVRFERFADLNTGGAIESLADDLLLATPSGGLALIRSDGVVEQLGGQVPMNRGALEALDLEPKVKGRFRVADILIRETRPESGELDLFATHHYFDGECGYRFRLSSTMLSWDEERIPALSPWKTIFDAEPCLAVPTLAQANQAGGKMLTDGPDHLLVIIGDHGMDGFGRHRNPILPQDPDSHHGKLVRIEIGTGAAEVLTMGHRAPQGLARDRDGNLWATEHGPQGGDELNLLHPDNNYGWPHVSYGLKYDGGALGGSGGMGLHDSFAQPAFAWVPSIGISGMVVNDAHEFPLWRDDLLIASLGDSSVFRVRRSGVLIRYVEKIETSPEAPGRIRDITHMADGRLASLVDRSKIVFLRPLSAG